MNPTLSKLGCTTLRSWTTRASVIRCRGSQPFGRETRDHLVFGRTRRTRSSSISRERGRERRLDCSNWGLEYDFSSINPEVFDLHGCNILREPRSLVLLTSQWKLDFGQQRSLYCFLLNLEPSAEIRTMQTVLVFLAAVGAANHVQAVETL